MPRSLTKQKNDRSREAELGPIFGNLSQSVPAYSRLILIQYLVAGRQGTNHPEFEVPVSHGMQYVLLLNSDTGPVRCEAIHYTCGFERIVTALH